MNSPVICFGQQPCGFFPKRFLVAKINTAKKLQKQISGKIVFFYHDSDADYRETITIFKDRFNGAKVRLNFTQENKLQKKHSPLYLKRIPAGWKEEIVKQLPRFIPPQSPLILRGEASAVPPLRIREGRGVIDIFKSVNEKTVADFCLQMYEKLGLLEGIEVIRSSEKTFREKAMNLKEYYVDVEYQGEIVRARIIGDNRSAPIYRPIDQPINGRATKIAILHEGGGKYTKFAIDGKIEKRQISADAKDRFAWMQSIIHCTHYIYGEGEKEYINFSEFPDVKFIQREKIENPEYAWITV
jgi:hypothetical protein